MKGVVSGRISAARYSESWYRDNFSTLKKEELVHMAAHLQVLSDERFKEIVKLRQELSDNAKPL